MSRSARSQSYPDNFESATLSASVHTQPMVSGFILEKLGLHVLKISADLATSLDLKIP